MTILNNIHLLDLSTSLAVYTSEYHKLWPSSPRTSYLTSILPYSLDITPPSIISPPLHICINLLRRYIYLQFMFLSTIHRKFNKNGRTLRLRRTRGRLELTVPPNMESSYLLASDTLTERLATRQQDHS